MMTADSPAAFRFCPRCADELIIDERHGRPRPTCGSCGFVQFMNPVAGVAVVIRDDDGRVLLGRRASGKYAGQWCIPCGYVEWGEEIREAGRRELEEETGLVATTGRVIAAHSNFHDAVLHTVGIWFEGVVTGGTLEAKDGELTELAYFDPSEAPGLAFRTDGLVLEQLAAES